MKFLISIAVLIALAVAQFPNQLPNFGNTPGMTFPGNNQQFGGNQQRPGGFQQYPGGNQQFPGGNQQFPGGNQQFPGGNQQFPGGNQQFPGFYQQQPGFSQQQPGFYQQQPGFYQQQPGSFQNQPGNFRQNGGFQQFYYPFAQSNFPLVNSYYWRQCASESRLPEDELNRFRNRDFTNQNFRENVQCFTHCILEKMGLIQNGEILDQRVLQVLSQQYPLDQISSRIATCRQQSRGFNRCESSYRFYICILNSANNQDIFRFAEIR